jgi:predicted secreted protein
MADPAAVHCVDIGGTLDTITDANGNQQTMCMFKNGNSCEEWALFRGTCSSGLPAIPVKNLVPSDTTMLTFTGADNGKTAVVRQGTRFAITLAENPMSGFSWRNATVSPGLTIISSTYQESETPEGMVGSGGARTWEIRADYPGTGKFSSSYTLWKPRICDANTFVLNLDVENMV